MVLLELPHDLSNVMDVNLPTQQPPSIDKPTETRNEEASLQMQKNNKNAKKRPRAQPQQSPRKKQRVEEVPVSKEGNMTNPRQSRKSAVKAKTCISNRKKLGNKW